MTLWPPRQGRERGMTDEQRMRERFEADCLHISEEQLARTEAGDYAIEWVHGTWIGYAIAYKARDAEVQALQRVLKDARFLIGKLAGWNGVDLNELDEEHDGMVAGIDAAIARAEGGGP